MNEQQSQPNEEELRAALEAELKRLRVDDLLLQSIVGFINLAQRRLGIAQGTEPERDLEQVRQAIEAVRSLLPLVSEKYSEQLNPIRDAVSQLQLAYSKE